MTVHKIVISKSISAY